MKSSIKRQIWLRDAAESHLYAEVLALFDRRRPAKNSTSFPRIISHYELLKELGRGAHGVIYLARTLNGHRLVALKIWRGYGDRQSRERFLREAACASVFKHPNIVGVCEIIQHRSTDVLVMEYVRGRTLDRVIPNRGLPLRRYVFYALQIADAVAAIHSAKMVHRDLKPRNFIVTVSGTVKLLDFGLAKIVGPRQRCPSRKDPKVSETRDGAILGTVAYMSPEQVRGKEVDQRSDIFSLGALFYEMLTGRCPFQKNTDIDSMAAILHEAPQKLPARIPGAIARIVRNCLAKEPSRRYVTAKELMDDLTLLAGH